MATKEVIALRTIWLEAFIAVLERASFTEAGKALGIHQSMVSRYVKELNDWIGMDLIAYKNPVAPTEAGKEFAKTARQILQLLQDTPRIRSESRPSEAATEKPKVQRKRPGHRNAR